MKFIKMISKTIYSQYLRFYRNKLSKKGKYDIGCLLRFSSRRIEFYRQLQLKNIDISCFPIVDKITYKKFGLNCFLDLSTRKKKIVRKTSGSTGIPTKIYIDKFTLSSQIFYRNYFYGLHGIKLGMREARFWSRKNRVMGRKINLRNFLLNRHGVDDLDFCGSVNHIREKLSPLYNVDYFYGYPSLILKAAHFFNENHFHPPSPKIIITTAEGLNSEQKIYLQDTFRCGVFQEYGCSEVDIIAFQCPCGSYHLNPRLYVEFVEIEGEDFEIIITDLFNYLMPIIRYKVGDVVKIGKVCKCGIPGQTLESVCGRSSNRFIAVPNDEEVHVSCVSSIIQNIVSSKSNNFKFRIDHIRIDYLEIKIDGNFNRSDMDDIKNKLEPKITDLFKNKITISVRFCSIDNSVKHNYYKKLF